MKKELLFKKLVFQLFLGILACNVYAGMIENKDRFIILQNVDIEIRGTVTNTTGETLPGVSVSIKGTKIVVVTDGSGRYGIAAPENATLVFTSIGYITQEIAVGGRTEINAILVPSETTLADVVVIGYQTVRRKDLTGASSTIDTENADRIVSRSVPEALQGLSPGVTIRNGGAPGQEAVVNIRGLNTFFGNASPLYIIDGMYADVNTAVNPNDVADIQVLKDASAAAIYGSRAANGVIIITTKRGRSEEPKIEVSSRFSVSQIPKKYEMMDGPDYVRMNTIAYQAGNFPLQNAVANYDGSVNTNWSDELLRTGAVQDYNASISGASGTSNYFISAGYFNDKGTLIARDFDRKSLRVNTETTKGRFKFGENISFTNSIGETPFLGGNFAGNPWYDMWSSVPIIPVQSNSLISTGNPGGWGYGSTSTVNTFARNQVAIANITSLRNNLSRLIGNAFLDFKILDGLNYRFNAGLETSYGKIKSIRKEGSWYQNQSPEVSQLADARTNFLSYLLEHTVNFNHTRGKHNFNGVVGYTEQTVQTDSISGGRLNLAQFGGNYFSTINSATGDMTSSGFLNKYLINSILGRLNYNYADKYLATLTFRSDKDSRFSPNNRTGNFPSAALAWRISNEDFFKLSWVTDLKIRGSYGVLGNANLGAYQYVGFLNQGPTVVFGPDQQSVNGATQARLVYEDLRWEEKRTTNIGFDAALLDNRFTVVFDIFRSVSKDVLVPQPVPQYLGNLQGDPLVNIGSIENKGIELELGYNPQTTGDFKWNIAANFSIIRNKVLELGNLGIDEATGEQRAYITSGNTRTQVGRAVGEYYVLRSEGIFQSTEEINAHRAQAAYAQPGDIRYRNLVDGGTDDDINDQDREFAGSPWPKLTTGLQFNSSYKNFSLNLQLYGSFGQKIYNDVLRELDSYGYSNYRQDLNPWTPTNTGTSDPRMGVGYAVGGEPADRGIVSNARGNSDRWLENGSFLRLRNVELGYTLPTSLLSRVQVSSARLYISAQNLFTITGYSGIDPDVVGANINLEPGVDNGNYPSSRIISFGLSIGF